MRELDIPLVTLLVVAAGGGIAYAVLRAAGLRGGTLNGYAAALAPGIGFGTASLLFFGAIAVGLPPPGVTMFLVLAAVLTGGAWLLSTRAPATEAPQRMRREGLGGPWVAIAACFLLAITLLGAVRTYRATAEHLPEGVWDAMAIWNVRARFLHRGWEQMPELFGMLDPRRGHADYPLMVPAAVAAQWSFTGQESPREPRAMALAFTLGLGALSFVVACRAGGPGVGAIASGVVLSSPSTLQWGFGQGADVVVAYYLLAALAVLSPPLCHRAVPLGLGGFLLGLLAWTKNEATVFALILGALFIAREWRMPQRWRSAASVAMGFAPAVFALAVFKLTWAPATGIGFVLGPDDAWSRLVILDRWIFPLREFGLRLVTPWSNSRLWDLWGLSWPLIGVGALVALLNRRRRAGTRYESWAGTVIGAVLAVWLVYVITPQPYQWQVQSSLDRFLFQIFPVAVVGLCSHLVQTTRESKS